MSSVLVIGAGPAGLAVSAALRALRIAPTLVDRVGRVGGAYREIAPDLAMASPVAFTALDREVPVLDHPGEYVLAGEYLAYLERFAERHGLACERASRVRALEPEPDGRWTATIEQENSSEVSRDRFSAAVVATGMWGSPVWPEIDGVSAREGEPIIEHSKDFCGARPHERVLVIGAATSAVEVAERAARDGATVVMSARGAVVRTVPKTLFGRDLHHYSTVFERLPRWMAARFCLDRPTILPTDLGFRAFEREGRVTVRGPLRSIDALGIARFEDGAVERVHRVVCATGFRYAQPFVPASVTRVAGASGLVKTTEDGESRSHPGLYFVGFPCARGVASEFLRGVARDAPAVARAVATRLGR